MWHVTEQTNKQDASKHPNYLWNETADAKIELLAKFYLFLFNEYEYVSDQVWDAVFGFRKDDGMTPFFLIKILRKLLFHISGLWFRTGLAQQTRLRTYEVIAETQFAKYIKQDKEYKTISIRPKLCCTVLGFDK